MFYVALKYSVFLLSVALSGLPNFSGHIPNFSQGTPSPHHQCTIHLNCESTELIHQAYLPALQGHYSDRSTLIGHTHIYTCTCTYNAHVYVPQQQVNPLRTHSHIYIYVHVQYHYSDMQVNPRRTHRYHYKGSPTSKIYWPL